MNTDCSTNAKAVNPIPALAVIEVASNAVVIATLKTLSAWMRGIGREKRPNRVEKDSLSVTAINSGFLFPFNFYN